MKPLTSQDMSAYQHQNSDHAVVDLRGLENLKTFGQYHPTKGYVLNNKKPRVLILQGPVGPFFGKLQQVFKEYGFESKRVAFNKGDRFFSTSSSSANFSGTILDWRNWLANELRINSPSAIVMFGSKRPAHAVAREMAKEAGIEVISLEEGYLRSGYVTCEANGNNQHSPLCDWTPGSIHPKGVLPVEVPSSYKFMCFWGAIYYLIRETFKNPKEVQLYHRVFNGPISAALSWTRHTIHKLWRNLVEQKTLKAIFKSPEGEYFLVPLQTPTDAQMTTASRGWSNRLLISSVLKELSQSDTDHRVVFKTHPLDVNGAQLSRDIRALVAANGLKNQVIVLQSGNLSSLTSHAKGMIVINSTSAFSAMHHRKPILVMGDAIYRHETLVSIGANADCISDFFNNPKIKNVDHHKAFIESIKGTALIPGDFYAPNALKLTAINVVERTISLLLNQYTMETDEKEAV